MPVVPTAKKVCLLLISHCGEFVTPAIIGHINFIIFSFSWLQTYGTGRRVVLLLFIANWMDSWIGKLAK